MPLRTRILLGWGLIIAVLGVSFAGVVIAQRQYAVAQVDDRLVPLTTNDQVQRLVARTLVQGTVASERLPAVVDGLYVGVVDRQSRLRTLATPGDVASAEPLLTSVPSTTPSTLVTVGGGRMRVVGIPARAGTTVVLGVALDVSDAATSRLMKLLALVLLAVAAVGGAIAWWTLRLGVAPIRSVTDVATALAGGDTSRRVPAYPEGTEAQDLGVAFNAMADANAASDERLRRFVADASHELRTPLTTLTGYTQLYAAGGLADRAAVDDAMARIRSEAGRMQNLVDGLLLLARLDAEPGPQRVPVDLGQLVHGLVTDLSVVAGDREIGRTDDGTAPYVVPGDPDQLAQVVSVLTSNAVRHTPPGTPVAVRLSHLPGFVRLEVSDRGPGIPEAELSRLFDRFHRVADGRSRASGGSGLGLAIAAAVVAAHGGRISVASRLGAGSTFTVELPRQDSRPAGS
ncbi:MAG TPA: ATP-binding protein [Candidatus Nanopelagicales bacterium]|nr:ATP-binding protein [Candidatus Nanopelagicales bacterium]